MAHFWRVLAAERGSGQCHEIDDVFKARPSGSYAEVCLACPVPGVNDADVNASGEQGRIPSCADS